MSIITRGIIQSLFPHKDIMQIKLKTIVIKLLNSRNMDPDDPKREYILDSELVSFDFTDEQIKQYKICAICGNPKEPINGYVYQPSLDYCETWNEMNLKLYKYTLPENYFPVCHHCVTYAHIMSPISKSIMLKGFSQSARDDIRLKLCPTFDMTNKQHIITIIKYYENMMQCKELVSLIN